ncbi:hypothetical protein A3J89_03545 [Candidatus Curtissbacteria bacterium RIFOXYB12_FULL_40_6]|nr:MAG: hypothetical protein A3J89_03545 [Candidatus Curtissbacteria bacterium RIFOXYB12_FULL_40_6]
MLNLFLINLLAQTTAPTMGSFSSAPVNLGFAIPSFDAVLTFVIRFFFILAGLVALIYFLLGALGWITSGGNKESVDKAREKIQSALIGIILIFFVLALVGVLENILGMGMGITKPILFPQLIAPPN